MIYSMPAVMHELFLIKVIACFCVAAVYSVGFKLTGERIPFVCALGWSLLGLFFLVFEFLAQA